MFCEWERLQSQTQTSLLGSRLERHTQSCHMKLHSQEVATLTLWIFTHMKLWLPEHRCIHARGSHECFISLDYTADTQTRKLTCTDRGKINCFHGFRNSTLLLYSPNFHAIFRSDLDPLQAHNNLDTGQKCKVQKGHKWRSFYRAVFKNSRCDLCLACFSFNVRRSFQVIECNSVLRWVWNWLCIRQQLMTTIFGYTSLFELGVPQQSSSWQSSSCPGRKVPHIIREWHMFECLCLCVYITYGMFCG